MANRGSLTANHFDHVHITFSGSSCTGKNCANARALASDPQQFTTDSSVSSLPSWAIAMVVLVVLSAIGTIVALVLVSRKMTIYQ